MNLKGEMVGLPRRLQPLYGYERPGGFAVPVDEVFRRALRDAQNRTLADYGFLGVDPAI